MAKKTLSDIPFNFYKYYKGLKEQGQKTHFKYLIVKKLGVNPLTFDKWVQRRELPGGSIQVHIIDLINDPNNYLPKI